MTTCESISTARELGRGIVEAQLAACVQLLEIRSVFRWEGAIQDDDEVLLLMKTRRGRLDELERFIEEHHDYDVPELVVTPVIGGSTEYLAWVDAQTVGGDGG
jgi:periplasmic divalent cation tolerance protein